MIPIDRLQFGPLRSAPVGAIFWGSDFSDGPLLIGLANEIPCAVSLTGEGWTADVREIHLRGAFTDDFEIEFDPTRLTNFDSMERKFGVLTLLDSDVMICAPGQMGRGYFNVKFRKLPHPVGTDYPLLAVDAWRAVMVSTSDRKTIFERNA